MKQTLTIVLICLILTPCAALAQQPTKPKVGVSEELGKALEVALAEVEHLRNQAKIKDDLLAGKDDEIKALRGLVQIEQMRVEAFSKASMERATALQIDDKRIGLYEADVLRLRTERDSARANQKWFGVGGLIFGTALGFLSQRK